jgi:hypothetical protein
MATPLSSAEWHRLAEQCRARADKLQDPIISERMAMIADGYDRIAHDAEKIEATSPCWRAPDVHLSTKDQDKSK